jgi:hypothetical protein
MSVSPCNSSGYRTARLLLAALGILVLCGCGYRFGTGVVESPFPADLKTVVVESAVNNTTITGIETELTNGLRQEFAVGQGLRPVRSSGDTVLKTVISSYSDTPPTYKADGKELIRIGTLNITCTLSRSDTTKVIWSKDLNSSYNYTVTDTIPETLTNRRRAISRMIKHLIPRIYQSLHNAF